MASLSLIDSIPQGVFNIIADLSQNKTALSLVSREMNGKVDELFRCLK